MSREKRKLHDPRPHPFERWAQYLPKETQETDAAKITKSIARLDESTPSSKRVSLDPSETWRDEDSDSTIDPDDLPPLEQENRQHDTMMIFEFLPDPRDVEENLSEILMFDEDEEDEEEDDHSNAQSAKVLLGVAAFPLHHAPTFENEATSLPAKPNPKKESKSQDSLRSPIPLEIMFEQQRAHLERSMRRSQESRKWLEQHIDSLAEKPSNLPTILADIEQSTSQVATLLRESKRDVHAVSPDVAPSKLGVERNTAATTTNDDGDDDDDDMDHDMQHLVDLQID